MIEPNIDAYGSLARASALADFLELLALHGKRCTKANLEDLVADQWSEKRRGLIVDAGEDPSEEPETYADSAFTCLEERAEILGERYPFAFSPRATSIRCRSGGTEPQSSAYIALLCATVAHASRLVVSVEPAAIVEQAVIEVFSDRNLLVAGIGTLSLQSGTFEQVLKRAANDVEVEVDLAAAPRRRYAKDAGVDTLAHLWWGDHRQGRWLFIGQATCASSDQWEGKAKEPDPARWGKFLMDPLDPQPFLAVPHHVEARTMSHIAHGRVLVLDRLRLAWGRIQTTSDEQTLVAETLAAPVMDMTI